jgi:hypothetical protein
VSIQRLLFLASFTVLTVAVFSTSRSTTTIFDNFGTDWDYNTGLGWTVAGPDSDNPFGVEQAMGFVPQSDGIVSDIWVAMAYVPSDPGPDVVTVMLADDDGGRPGQVLETWIFSEIEDWNQWNPPLHGEGAGVSHLQADALYWLWAAPVESSTWVMWNVNNIDDVGPHTLRRTGEDWLPVSQETRSVFRIDVDDLSAVSDGSIWASRPNIEIWPNPARGDVSIRCRAVDAGNVELGVYDVLGSRIRTFSRRGPTNATDMFIWDARTDTGHPLPPGTYFYELRVDGRLVETAKGTILR